MKRTVDVSNVPHVKNGSTASQNCAKTHFAYDAKEIEICHICLNESLPFQSLNDEDYEFTVKNNRHISERERDRLEGLKFNPFSDLRLADAASLLKRNESNLGDLVDNENIDCNYFLPNEFAERFAGKNIEDNLKLMHLNIRSISNKFDLFNHMLGSLNTNFSVIGLTETCLHDDNQDNFSFKNYDFVNVNRKLKKGGGVGIYISQHLKYKTRNDLNATKEDIIESVFTEIPTKVSKNIIVGVIYRPPNSKFDEFERTLNETLSKIDKENKTCYLMGDFNVDMLKNETCDFANRLTQNLFTSFYFPLITMPTRITQHTATLIDNLFSNDLEKINYSQNGLIFSDISDHLPIFHICGVNKENTKNRKKH